MTKWPHRSPPGRIAYVNGRYLAHGAAGVHIEDRGLQFGDARPFETFDRLGHVNESRGKTLSRLLDEFARLRDDNLRELRALNLQPSDLERRGRHPALGPVTLSQLLATWPAHDLSHLHQLSRVMAHQVRGTVGPWTAFLGVMQCEGHST